MTNQLQQPRGAGLSSRKEHGLWLGSASPHFTSEPTPAGLTISECDSEKYARLTTTNQG